MSEKIVVIGAGVGGLAAAMRLAQNAQVTVLEAHSAPGGKMRTVPSIAGPVDAGPTVMTMRWVFEDLFQAANANLSDEVTLVAEDVLARHWWPDGSTVDFYADRAKTIDAIGRFSGAKAARQFDTFCKRAARLFNAFDAPMMQAPAPSIIGLTKHVLANPSLIPDMAPGLTLARSLSMGFTDPRLRQLFGRYATYVGGSPYASPAILALIWHAEAQGVWRIEGGMHMLAKAMERVAIKSSATLLYDQPATRLEMQSGKVVAVHTKDHRFEADRIVFAGDPQALHNGFLAESTKDAVDKSHVFPRSLSAYVWSFAAEPNGVELDHHNVFFTEDPHAEFSDLAKGRMPRKGTLYVCAQDRGSGADPKGPERFEIILNGPPRQQTDPIAEEMQQCRTTTFDTLRAMGLTFSPTPELTSLTTPEMFNRMFPGSDGSLYGRSPHGMTAALKRPTARTKIPGLYLAGGGAHPGAGIPMAALSGLHVAAAIEADRTSTSTYRKTATLGGTSTA